MPQATDPVPDNPAKTFDIAVCGRATEDAVSWFLHCPELRSVAIVLDYRGNINDAGVSDLVWLEADTPNHIVGSPAALIGSMHQTVKLMDVMQGRCYAYLNHCRQQLARTLDEEKRLREQIAQLQAERTQLETEKAARAQQAS